jgi:hypothetical protein
MWWMLLILSYLVLALIIFFYCLVLVCGFFNIMSSTPQPTCPVCLEPIRLRVRLQPCGHSVCHRCVSNIIHHALYSGLSCPECRSRPETFHIYNRGSVPSIVSVLEQVGILLLSYAIFRPDSEGNRHVQPRDRFLVFVVEDFVFCLLYIPLSTRRKMARAHLLHSDYYDACWSVHCYNIILDERVRRLSRGEALGLFDTV